MIFSLLINIGFIVSLFINKNDKPIFDPFQVNYNVNEKSLKKNGFKIIPFEEGTLMGKQIGDTLIYYELDCGYWDNNCKKSKVDAKISYIYFLNIDSLILQRFSNKHNAQIISTITNNEFFVQHRFSKEIFKCHIEKPIFKNDSVGFELIVLKEFPWNDDKIEERIEEFKFLDEISESEL